MRGLKRIAVRVTALGMSVFVILSGTAGYSFADTLSEAEKHKSELQEKKEELKDTLSDLENEKTDIMQYIEKIDGKLNKVSADMGKLKKKVKANKKAIKELEAQIVSAEQEIQNQYETMKRRIKYMYENGSTDYLNILLSSESVSDLLSRSEYIEKISEYDSGMLDVFVASKNDLEVRKTDLVAKREELECSMEELKLEQDALQTITDKKKDELDKYSASIESAETEINEYDSELERQEQIIADALLEQQRRIAEEEKRRAEAARKAAAKKKAEADKKAAEEKAAAESANRTADPSQPTAEPVEDIPEEPTAAESASGFKWPLPVAGKITSVFGKRTSPTAGASTNHQGIDISASSGTAILAAKGGTVVTASYSGASGNYVMINHGGGVFTVYMHASSLAVSVGQEVSQGETIAYVGSTGVSTGAHLHFGVSIGGAYVNPSNYVSN